MQSRGPQVVTALVCAAALVVVSGCESGTAAGSGTPSAAAPVTASTTLTRSSGSTSAGFGPVVAALPLAGVPATARQAVTVVVPTAAANRGRIARWNRVQGGWQRDAPDRIAYVGKLGVKRAPLEAQPYSPIGSFPITEGFGRFTVPGTRLPYRRTGPDDWWISQSGPLYNTLQHCRIACPFRPGPPNAPLADVRPQYDYAVVIDYNRHPVRQGAGSGFFLHVAKGRPTNGCVATQAAEMQTLLRWVDPAQHPRLLIGVGR